MKHYHLFRGVILAICGVTLATGEAEACSGVIRSNWNSWNYIKVNLAGFPATLQNQAHTALNMAMNAWNTTCTQGTIPHFSTEPPYGGAYYAQFTFEYVAGAHPNSNTKRICGSYENAGLSKVYAFQWEAGQLEPCPMNDLSKLAHILAHEIGHRLGLDDSDCVDYIMSRLPAGIDGSFVKLDECWAANSVNATATERGVCDQPNDCRVSPILLSCQADPWILTSVDRGVDFDFDGDGSPARSAWTRADSPLAFLFTDLDGTGCPESGAELFGENRLVGEGILAENGFEALDGYDSDRNGWITRADRSWSELRLWVDHSHDGLCTSGEVASLDEARVQAIQIAYGTSDFVDRHGNAFRYYSQAVCREPGGTVRRPVWDVYLATSGTD